LKIPPLLELFNNEAVNHSLEKWREMEKKCDFGQNCKNKALNTLTNCSKLTINHLRYLKSNSKELEIAGNYLILNRAGINVITLAMIPQALVSKKKCVPCISYIKTRYLTFIFAKCHSVANFRRYSKFTVV
jgi:hypothetical protein